MALALLTAALAASCGGSARDEDRVLVFAAASLGNAFTDIANEYQAQNPNIDIELNISGSSSLREQVLAGAPADIFASANESNMATLEAAGELAGPIQPLARNTMALAVSPTAKGTSLVDLADPNLLVGLCDVRVPCGELAEQVLANASVTAAVDTFEPDVRSLLTKISEGELDAGVLYQSDVVGAGDAVIGVAIDPAVNVTTTYPIARLRSSMNNQAADAFIAFALSAQGQTILAKHGFEAP